MSKSKAKTNPAPYTSIVTEYLNLYSTYKAKYGERTLVLMQVGSFYESYATDQQGPNLHEIAKLINIITNAAAANCIFLLL